MSTRPTDVVRVWDVPRQRAGLVLLVLDNGNGVVLPAENEFLAALTIQDGNLVDVSYEPSDNTTRWRQYRDRASELRALRSIVASATRRGTFRLAGDDALKLARRMQYVKTYDPSLAVYAAYAYNDLHREDLIAEMHEYLKDLGSALFDVAMRTSADRGVAGRWIAISFAPLVPGLGLPGIAPDPAAERARGPPKTLVGSVWTQFDPGRGALRRSPSGRRSHGPPDRLHHSARKKRRTRSG
jgi:hypothetical protein